MLVSKDAAALACEAAQQDVGIELILDSDFLSVNGVDAGAHENLVISKSIGVFQFAKTARKPYDVVITGLLAMIKFRLGDDF